MKLRKSLAGGFILIVMIILSVGQGSLWSWFLFTQKEHNMQMLEDKVKTISVLLANFSSDAALMDNYEAVDRYIGGLTAEKDIITISIVDSKGNVLRKKVLRPEQTGKSLNPFLVPWSNKIRVPVKSGSEDIGAVEIVYSGRKANEAMIRLLTVPPIGQTVVFLIMIYGIYFFFQKKVGSPVGTIQKNIKKVTEGDLTVKIPQVGSHEVSIIARGLKFLVEGFLSAVTKLYSTADNVAMAIKQLNLTFGIVTKSIEKQSASVDNISLSLRKANESYKRISESTDELSRFSSENVASLLQMKTIADEIAGSTNTLFQASENSYSIIAEMSQTAKTMADNAEKMLLSVEDTSAAVDEIGTSVKEVENNAKDSTTLAENVREIAAAKAVLTVADAIEGMEKISDKVKYSVEVVRRLGARSKDIEKMLSVIKEVTEQTNLLSLNAAILAAQAGEYGKGFSVVADEIRALSDRTAASTKEITGIVSTIQSEIADAVTSIESGMELVDYGSGLVYSAGESMASVLEAAQKSARMARSIEKATEEQSKGLRQVSMSVEDIKKMVLHMTKATGEQSKSSAYLLERMGEVREVAEVSKKGTEEQATGTKIISKNLEMTSEKINEIAQSIASQQTMNEGSISHIEQIRNIGAATLRDVESLAISMTTLQDEINLLRKEMEVFRIK